MNLRNFLNQTLRAAFPLLLLTLSTQVLGAEECTTDAECGEYLRCLAPPPSCVDDGSGVSCEEAPSDAARQCGIAALPCSSTSNCPREFECITHSDTCADIACEEGAPDCRPCTDGRSQFCQPSQISCVADVDCPSEWSCQGGGSTVADLPTTTEKTDEVPAGESGGTCIPNEWGGVVDDVGETTGEGAVEHSSSPDDGPEAGGGCSVSTTGRSDPISMMLLLPVLAATMRRRRVQTRR